LADKPRCGAPHKLSEPEVQRLVQWANIEPLTAAALLARHNEAQGRGVHLNTLVSELKRHGFVWKRSRHSLKKSVTPWPSSKPGATSPR
jgi:transposase